MASWMFTARMLSNVKNVVIMGLMLNNVKYMKDVVIMGLFGGCVWLLLG